MRMCVSRLAKKSAWGKLLKFHLGRGAFAGSDVDFQMSIAEHRQCCAVLRAANHGVPNGSRCCHSFVGIFMSVTARVIISRSHVQNSH